jgi:hypothetical protein
MRRRTSSKLLSDLILGTDNDGFRVIARKHGPQVRLYSRPGNDLTYRFPLIVEALTRLRLLSCIINGEAVACDHKGTPSFDRLRPIWWFDPARIALALPSANVCFSPGRRTPCNAALDRCRSQHLQL